MDGDRRIPRLRLVQGSVAHAGTLVQWAVANAFRATIPEITPVPAVVSVEGSRYECRLVTDRTELRKVFKLRYEVFRNEYGTPPSIFQLDVDGFDRRSQHLAVFERASGDPVGVYRLVSSSRRGFYAQTEFVLEPFLARAGRGLELGRACVHPEHRNGAVLRMLWKALITVAHSQGADHLFGCSSVVCPRAAERGAASDALVGGVMRELVSRGAWHPIAGIRPRRRYTLTPQMSAAWTLAEAEQPHARAVGFLPPLLVSYLRAGARVVAPPAYDRAFGCLDLLTVFPLPPRI